MNTVSNKRVSNKNKINSNKPTLDVQHTQQLHKMEEMQQRKKTLELDLKRIEDSLSAVNSELSMIDDDDARDAITERLLFLKDSRLQIIDEIKQIDDRFNIDKYFTDTADILFQYYDILEKGTAQPSQDLSKDSIHEHSILKYFGCGHTACAATKHATKKNEDQHIIKEHSRGVLLDQYLRLTSTEYIDYLIQAQVPPTDNCAFCKSTSIVTMVNDGYVFCSDCNNIEYIIIDHEKPSYRDPPKEISFYAYKRSNHLNEWLSQMQGKETTDIPEEVYDKILLEIRKQKITNMALITPKKIRDILRKLQINKYEHIPHIINRLTGRPMLQMPPDLEEKLRNMFKQVQAPFLKHAPPTRKNFLSYSYCLHKMLQLLGKDEFLGNCGLLKSKDKLFIQDTIWKKICQDLDWQFIPSI